MFCKTFLKNSLVFTITIGLVLVGYLKNPAQTSTSSEFDINNVPIVNPKLGKFPYFSLIEGYQPGGFFYGENRNVAFDRYEFFDGTKIITVEGRLQSIVTKGNSASAYEIIKTYESLVKDLGGVVVFEGSSMVMYKRGLKFKERHNRPHPVSDYLLGVYVIRTPNTEIWVEAYTIYHPGIHIGYILTVVEKQPLKARATLLTAEVMKKEIDSKGRVDVNIDFEDDKPDIKPKSQPTINEIEKLMKKNPKLKLTVKGRYSKTANRENNRKVSEARANSVVKALTARGIAASRLKAVGTGQDRETGSQRAETGSDGVELVKTN